MCLLLWLVVFVFVLVLTVVGCLQNILLLLRNVRCNSRVIVLTFTLVLVMVFIRLIT